MEDANFLPFAKGQAGMFDVTTQDQTRRGATARGKILMCPDIVRAIEEGDVKKRDVRRGGLGLFSIKERLRHFGSCTSVKVLPVQR